MKVILALLSIFSLVASSSYYLTPDSNSCSTFKVHYLDTVETASCISGLHFSPTKSICMLPEEARCEQKYWCSGSSAPNFFSDLNNCKTYYECVNGVLVKKNCRADLWWDYKTKRCVHKSSVRCYGQTFINTIDDEKDNENEIESSRLPRTLYENPNMGACNRRKDLFENGKYLKSVYIIEGHLNYETARQRCATNNMNLFIIDDDEGMQTFYDIIMDLVTDVHAKGTVWINGKRNSNSKEWEVHNPDGSILGPLYNGVDFFSKHALEDCLSLTGRYTGKYQALGISCSAGAWATCEYHKRTESPPQLESNTCHYKKDLYYKGKYLKSMCVINQGLKYDKARRKCASLGMNLFIFDNAKVDKVFFDSCEDILKQHPSGAFWINGKRDCSTNKWYVYHVNDTVSGLLYEDIEWVSNGVCGKTNGNCLKLSAQHGPYRALGSNCDEAPWVICEYYIRAKI